MSSPVTPARPQRLRAVIVHKRLTRVAAPLISAARTAHPPLATQRVAEQPRLPTPAHHALAATTAPGGDIEDSSGRNIRRYKRRNGFFLIVLLLVLDPGIAGATSTGPPPT